MDEESVPRDPAGDDRHFPAFALEALDGRRWDEGDLRGTRAVVFCFASW